MQIKVRFVRFQAVAGWGQILSGWGQTALWRSIVHSVPVSPLFIPSLIGR
jgi:hypothetical protein